MPYYTYSYVGKSITAETNEKLEELKHKLFSTAVAIQTRIIFKNIYQH